MSAPQGPLHGIRIADFTTVVMGPLATRMLGDMGADVIRVEAPGGDIIRQYAPMRSPRMGAFSMNVNRNKRSAVVDMKTTAGRTAALDLIATCDVFVTNHRRKALDRLGLDEKSVRQVKPDIVYCVTNGFGSDGPSADKPAYDDIIQAASGLASTFNWNADQPMFVPSIVADKITGVHVAFAIAAALAGRATTGHGASLEVPMAETMAAFNLVEHLGGQTFNPTDGPFSYQRVTTPHRRPRKTSDGWIAILPYTEESWDQFFEFGGKPELMGDSRFASAYDRVQYAEILYPLMDEVIRRRTTTEWLDFCDANNIPAAPVTQLDELIEDEHLQAVGLFVDHDHSTEGPIRYVRDAIVVDGAHNPMRHDAPRLAQQTAEVFAEIGYTEAQIAELLAVFADTEQTSSATTPDPNQQESPQ
ncbi:MAG: CaiB/BaiF CoA transferase family protein [Acidimicrobiales bacterium]